MVATVGSISIDLSTNTAKFTQGFKQSATTVERESKRMANAVNGFSKASKAASGIVSGFVGGIAAGGALAAIGSLSGALAKARQSLSDFEEIGNRAKATGLGTDTFQAISHGASLADVEQESLNKSLEIFAKNVGLAEKGSGGLYSSLIKLNPQLLQSVLSAGDQESRLKLVADAMASMTDATQKAALATAVFGKGGAEMVRVLDKGSASIEEMKRNAKDLGIIIPEDLIKRSGELDDKLTTLSKVVDIQLSQALVKAAPLLVAAAKATATFATELNEVTTAINAFVSNPSLATLGELLDSKLFSAGLDEGGLADQFRDWLVGAERAAHAQERIQDEIKITNDELTRLFAVQKQGLFDVDQQIVEQLKKLTDLKQAWREAGQAAAAGQASSALAGAFSAAAANAAKAALRTTGGGGGGALPAVHHGVDAVTIDPDVMDDVENAIDKETEATNRVAARAGDVYRGVQTLDTNTAGYFDGLGSRIEGGLQEVGRALSYSVAANSGYATGGASSFRYSGNNSSGSWAGRQMTFGGNAEADSAYYNSVFGGRANRVGDAASTITSGGTTSGAVNVNIVVKPVMEGSRLSGQSTAEIKQAAAAGANAALRTYYGR